MRTHVALPSLIHGISQLNAAERQPVHALACDNTWSPVEHGDQKRPPLIHVAKVFNGDFGDCYCHGINRGSGEQYISLFKFGATVNNGLVFDLSGNVIPVFKNTAGSNAAQPVYAACDYIYLANGSSPAQNIRALSVLDYTFIVNRNTAVTMSNSTSTASPTDRAHVFIRQGAFAMKYTIKIQRQGGTLYTINASTHDSIVTTAGGGFPIISVAEGFAVFDQDMGLPGSGVGIGRSSVRTQDIAEMLKAKLNGGVAAPAATYGTNVVAGAINTEFTVTRNGSVLKIVSTGGVAITVFEVSTSQGNQLAFGIQNETDSFSNLPLVFTHGYIVKIKGSSLDDADDFYVKFTGADTALTTLQKGTWSEDLKPGSLFTWTYSASSFHPHALIRRAADGTALGSGTGGTGQIAGTAFFSFEPMNLSNRLVGESSTNPNPSFVSVSGTYQPSGGQGGGVVSPPVIRKVRDVVFFRDRLILCSDESLSCSEQGVYFNFFRTTVRSLPDSDPVDVSISSSNVAVISSMVPLGGKLILFAEESQHQFLGSPSLTPSTVESDEVSKYSVDPAARPAAYEDGILFPTAQGNYSTIGSLVQSSQTENKFTAINLSVHTPTFIEGSVKQIEVTTDSSIIAVLGSSDVDAIYILKQHREGDNIIQSAWLRFLIDDATVRGIQFFGNKLYVLSQRSDGLYLEYIDLSPGVADVNGSSWLYLDRRVTTPSATNAANSVVTMPYPIEAGATMEVVTYPGLARYVAIATGGSTFTVATNLNGLTFVAGKKYTSTRSFHKPQVQVDAQTGKRLVLDSTSSVIGLNLRYEDTTFLKLVVGSDIKTVGGDGGTYITPTTPLEPSSGSVFVGVGGRLDSPFAVSAVNDSPFPHTLVSGEWLLNTTIRSKAQ